MTDVEELQAKIDELQAKHDALAKSHDALQKSLEPPKSFDQIEKEDRDPNAFVFHENGSKIPVHQAWLLMNYRRVKAVDGTFYHHVGEDAEGKWTYREER